MYMYIQRSYMYMYLMPGHYHVHVHTAAVIECYWEDKRAILHSQNSVHSMLCIHTCTCTCTHVHEKHVDTCTHVHVDVYIHVYTVCAHASIRFRLVRYTYIRWNPSKPDTTAGAVSWLGRCPYFRG